MTANMGPDTNKVQSYLRRWGVLDNEYSTWKTRHQEVMRFIQPYRARFELDEQRSGGLRKDQAIINDTATGASRALAAALATGITSPARRWFRLKAADPVLADNEEVKQYLRDWEDVLFGIFSKSNIYKILAQLYLDLAGPATGVAFLESDDLTVIRGVHAPCGQYRLAVDRRGEVNTIFHRFAYTVAQVIEAFCSTRGKPDDALIAKRCSTRIQKARQNKKFDEWVTMLHVVEPRLVRQYGRLDKINKPWASCWLEWSGQTLTGQPTGGEPEELLREDGFDEKPFIAPRWDVTGEDAYGIDSPGMNTIGDVKALQSLEMTGAGFLALGLDPALNIPAKLASASILPGKRNRLPDGAGPGTEVKATYEPDRGWVEENREEKRALESRINRGHFANLLLAITNDDSADKDTAEGIRAKKQEILLQLGGMYQRVSDEGLTGIVDRTYAEAQRQGKGPKPPDVLVRAALQGKKTVDIEYDNILSQAQKAVGSGAVQQWVGGLVQMAEGLQSPEPTDSINIREVATASADMLGIPPKMVATDEQVQQKQAARAQAQQAQQQQEAMKAAAPAAKAASQIDPEQLRQVLQQLPPVAGAEGLTEGA